MAVLEILSSVFGKMAYDLVRRKYQDHKLHAGLAHEASELEYRRLRVGDKYCEITAQQTIGIKWRLVIILLIAVLCGVFSWISNKHVTAGVCASCFLWLTTLYAASYIITLIGSQAPTENEFQDIAEDYHDRYLRQGWSFVVFLLGMVAALRLLLPSVFSFTRPWPSIPIWG
jgi:hypothetical protein